MKIKKQKTIHPTKTDKKDKKPFKDYTVIEKFLWFSQCVCLILIVLMPISILLSAKYWTNFSLAPKFYLSSVFFFLIPFWTIMFKPFWRNPFFVLPFSISFTLASQTINYEQFLINYWCFFACIITLFAIHRTRPPYRALERRLYETDYFIDYFEVRNFWRTVILTILPMFIPFFYFFVNVSNPLKI